MNVAMRQAMLGERIAKLYVQAGLRVLQARAFRALALAMQEFEAGLKVLLEAAPTNEIRDNYHLLRLLWDDARPIAARAPTPDGAKRLAERTDEIVWTASKGARLLQANAATRASEPIRLVGEARLLAQRIAKLYLLRAWVPRAAAILDALRSADRELDNALGTLAKSAAVGTEAGAELQLAHNQHAFLRPALERLIAGRPDTKDVEFVAKTSDNLLEVMERVARRLETGAG